MFLETIIIPWIWFDFGDFGENYYRHKSSCSHGSHVTFVLIMIDYLISNANSRFKTPVIKMISDNFADLSVKNDRNWVFQNLDILDFHIWFRNWTFGGRPKCPLKRSVDGGPWPLGDLFEDRWVIKLHRHQERVGNNTGRPVEVTKDHLPKL